MTTDATTSEHDLHWMQRALELAQRGTGLCSPNPIVGCVILDSNGHLCGEGWHEYDLRDHAEVAALKVAGERARGGTAYVTLEPCNHTGRTGPCSRALIMAGIKRVVIATLDPNTQVSGGGLQILQAASINTNLGILQPEARRLNEVFARWSQTKRPFVLTKIAMSLDGRIAPPVDQRERREVSWITGEWSREAVQRLRWQSDAVLTGIDTVLCDDPLLTDRSGQRRRRPLLRVVLDSTLRIPVDSKLVATAQSDVLVFTTSRDQNRISELHSRGVRVEVLSAEDGRVPLGRVLEILGSENILSLLTETGSRLNSALLAAGLIDRIQFFTAPQIMGATAIPAFCGLDHSLRFENIETEHCGNDLSLTALLRDPWQQKN